MMIEMILATVYKKGKGLIINLSGNEINQLKIKHGDKMIGRIEEDGTKLVLKVEKAIQI